MKDQIIGPFSQEERNKVRELIDTGGTFIEIGAVLSRSEHSIKTEVRSGGGRNLYNPNRPITTSGKRRDFSEKEKKRLKEMVKGGLTIKDMRAEMKCGSILLHRFLLEENLVPTKSTSKWLTNRLEDLQKQINMLKEKI